MISSAGGAKISWTALISFVDEGLCIVFCTLEDDFGLSAIILSGVVELPADEVEALSGSFSAVVELPADEVERDMYAPTHVHVSKQCDYWAGTSQENHLDFESGARLLNFHLISRAIMTTFSKHFRIFIFCGYMHYHYISMSI